MARESNKRAFVAEIRPSQKGRNLGATEDKVGELEIVAQRRGIGGITVGGSAERGRKRHEFSKEGRGKAPLSYLRNSKNGAGDLGGDGWAYYFQTFWEKKNLGIKGENPPVILFDRTHERKETLGKRCGGQSSPGLGGGKPRWKGKKVTYEREQIVANTT